MDNCLEKKQTLLESKLKYTNKSAIRIRLYDRETMVHDHPRSIVM